MPLRMERRTLLLTAASVIVIAAIAVAFALPAKDCNAYYTNECRSPGTGIFGATRQEPNWPLRIAVVAGGLVVALIVAATASPRHEA
jgi:hypothetical protein